MADHSASDFADVKRFKPLHGIRRAIVTLTVNSGCDYATPNGWIITPAAVGFNGIYSLRAPTIQSDGSVMWAFRTAPGTSPNWTLRAYALDAGAEFGDAGTSFDGDTIRLEVEGY